MTTQVRPLTEVPCAFCRGEGKDPFGVFSFLSTCGGRGALKVPAPVVPCAFCRGSGVYPGSRLTCIACGGLGVHPVAERTMRCPNCLGHGVDPASEAGFYCLVCHGAGVVGDDGTLPQSSGGRVR
jgi:DnaJ-class molecular chaperone